MNRDELDKKLEEWLDRAAAEHGRADIRPGFEERIIADLHARLDKRRRNFFWIPIAAAITVAVIFSLYFIRPDFQDGRPKEISSLTPSKIAVERQGESPAKAHDQAAITVQSSMASFGSPKTPVAANPPAAKPRPAETGRFLSSGLSDRERYLMAFVRLTSSEEASNASEAARFDRLWKAAEIPEFRIPEFKVPSFEIGVTPKPAAMNEEIL